MKARSWIIRFGDAHVAAVQTRTRLASLLSFWLVVLCAKHRLLFLHEEENPIGPDENVRTGINDQMSSFQGDAFPCIRQRPMPTLSTHLKKCSSFFVECWCFNHVCLEACWPDIKLCRSPNWNHFYFVLTSFPRGRWRRHCTSIHIALNRLNSQWLKHRLLWKVETLMEIVWFWTAVQKKFNERQVWKLNVSLVSKIHFWPISNLETSVWASKRSKDPNAIASDLLRKNQGGHFDHPLIGGLLVKCWLRYLQATNSDEWARSESDRTKD